MEGGMKRTILTEAGKKVMDAIVFILIVAVISFALAGLHG
jgi:hypothetical protein